MTTPDKSPLYNRLYQRVRAAAIRDLIEQNRELFHKFLHEYKHEYGLTHRHPDQGHAHEQAD